MSGVMCSCTCHAEPDGYLCFECCAGQPDDLDRYIREQAGKDPRFAAGLLEAEVARLTEEVQVGAEVIAGLTAENERLRAAQRFAIGDRLVHPEWGECFVYGSNQAHPKAEPTIHVAERPNGVGWCKHPPQSILAAALAGEAEEGTA